MLKHGEFEVNKNNYGANCVLKSQLYLKNGEKLRTTGNDFTYTNKLAALLEANLPPSASDPTNGRLYFYQYYNGIETKYPNGINIGGNYFYNLGCGCCSAATCKLYNQLCPKG